METYPIETEPNISHSNFILKNKLAREAKLDQMIEELQEKERFRTRGKKHGSRPGPNSS